MVRRVQQTAPLVLILGLLVLYVGRLIQERSIVQGYRNLLILRNHETKEPTPALIELEATNSTIRSANTTTTSTTLFAPSDFMPQLTTQEPRTWENLNKAKRALNFVHIPKTGGSSIVRIAASNGLAWGDCMFPSTRTNTTFIDSCPAGRNFPPWPWHNLRAVWWHVPTQYLSPRIKNPYENQDLFAIVRNPYERAVSEYYYWCSHNKKKCFGSSKANDSAPGMNTIMQTLLKKALFATKNTTAYYVHSGHWVPLYDYFYDESGKRLVEHLLHVELLPLEFPSLMAAYGLKNLTLPAARTNSRNHLEAAQDVNSLTASTMKLIEVVFEKDFALGGYQMLSGKKMALMDGERPPPIASF